MAKPTPTADDLGIVDPLRRLILNAINERGLDMQAVSERLGKNKGYIGDYIRKGSPRKLPEDIRETLGKILGIPEEMLKPKDDGFVSDSEGYILDRIAVPPPGPRDLPVYSTQMTPAGSTVDFRMGPKGLIDRPAHLVGFTDAFAFYMPNDSMSPAIRAGQACYCNPIKPLTVPCLVLLQLADDRAAVYEFRGQDAAKWHLRVYGAEPRDLEIESDQVKRSARIVLVGDPS